MGGGEPGRHAPVPPLGSPYVAPLILWGALTWLPLVPLGWFALRGQWMGFVAAVILAVIVWSRVKKEPARSK